MWNRFNNAIFWTCLTCSNTHASSFRYHTSVVPKDRDPTGGVDVSLVCANYWRSWRFGTKYVIVLYVYIVWCVRVSMRLRACFYAWLWQSNTFLCMRCVWMRVLERAFSISGMQILTFWSFVSSMATHARHRVMFPWAYRAMDPADGS